MGGYRLGAHRYIGGDWDRPSRVINSGLKRGMEGGCFERCARALFDSGAARVYEASEHHVLARLKFK